MKLGADDANRLLALIGHLHDAATTEEIAVSLGMRPAAATTHVRNLLAKLGVESRLVAAMAAIGVAQTRA